MTTNDIILSTKGELKELIQEALVEILDERIPEVPADSRDYYTRKELAEKWQVCLVTLWRYVKLGMLHPVKIGGVVRFLKEEIDELDGLDLPKDGSSYRAKVDKELKRRKQS